MLDDAKNVLRLEARAIEDLIAKLDDQFCQAVEWMFACASRVVVTGMGKPGLIGRKIASTLASTGTPALFMHPAEAIHGDFGMVVRDDVILAISNSGETEEVVRLIPMIKRVGARMIALTGNRQSTLANNSDCVLDVGVEKEACPMGLAPTTSTTAALAMGDALAVALIHKRNFQQQDYAALHPGGSLGKRMFLTASDVMRKGDHNPMLEAQTPVKEVLIAITRSHAGAANIVDDVQKLIGIFTDGDLRRAFEKGRAVLEEPVCHFMTQNPKTVQEDQLAVEALRMMEDAQIDELPVVNADQRCVGMLDIQDLLRAGIL